MQKSPINILQEISVMDGYFPIYTYVTINNSTNNNNKFACKVTCKDISANGIAKNKKEAKQIAAENMLLLMNKGYKSSYLLCQAECTTKNNMKNPGSVEIDEIDKDLQDKPSSIYFSRTQSSTLNYVGQLQELCTKYKLRVLPAYKVIDASGPCHMKIFTVEVSVEFLRETGIAHCKKNAKQQAAKNLLARMRDLKIFEAESIQKHNHSREIFETNNILQQSNEQLSEIRISETELPITELSENSQSNHQVEDISNNMDKQKLGVENNDSKNLLQLESFAKDVSNKIIKTKQQALEDDLRKLNVNIQDLKISNPTLPVVELSEKAKLLYVQSTSDRKGINSPTVKDGHHLFKSLYSNRMSDNLKKKIKTACELNDSKSYLIRELMHEIQNELGVKMEQAEQYTKQSGAVLASLRLMSTPIIAQYGIGKSVYDAENMALLQMVKTIQNFLK